VCHCEKVLEHCRKPVFRLATTGSRAANGSSVDVLIECKSADTVESVYEELEYVLNLFV